MGEEDRIHLAQERDQWCALVKMLMSSIKYWEYLDYMKNYQLLMVNHALIKGKLYLSHDIRTVK